MKFLLILIIFSSCQLVDINDNHLELTYFITHNPIDAYCYIDDKPIIADWAIAVDENNNVIEDTTQYCDLSDSTIGLTLFTNEIVPFREKYRGYWLLLENKSELPAKIMTQDGRLSLYQEAKDRDGKWKPIENLPWSFCGNSYYSVVLSPKDSFYFVVPVYHGNFTTKLRFKLLIEHDDFIVSNEFNGSINRSQFINGDKSYGPDIY